MTVRSGILAVVMGAMAVILVIAPAQAVDQKSTSQQTTANQQQKQQNQRVQTTSQQHQVKPQGNSQNKALNQLKDIAGQGPRVNDHRYHGELYNNPGPDRSKNSVEHPKVKPTPAAPAVSRPTAVKDNNYAHTGNPIYKNTKPSQVPPLK